MNSSLRIGKTIVTFVLLWGVTLQAGTMGDDAAAEEALLYTARIQDEGDSGNGDFELFLNTADGQTIRLTDNDMDDCDPDWNGDKIVLERGNWDWEEPSWEIWLLDPFTGEEELIVERAADANYNYNPKLSPDGSRVLYWVYWKNRSVSNIPYVLNLETGEVKKVGLPEGNSDYARWTPDGSGIVFVLSGGEGDAIAVMDMDTLKVNELVAPAAGVSRYDPAVSPDGERVVFQETDYEAEVRRVRMASLAGSQITTVYEGSEGYSSEIEPEWSVSGKAIYFNPKIDGNTGLSLFFIDKSQTTSIDTPESDWVGVPSASLFAGFEPGLVLRAVEYEKDWVRLEAEAIHLREPINYYWSLMSSSGSYCRLDPQRSSAKLFFDLPRPVIVQVVAEGASGNFAEATLEVEPLQDE